MKRILAAILTIAIFSSPFLSGEDGWQWIAHGKGTHKIYEKVRKYYILPADIVIDETGILVPIEGSLFYVTLLHKDKRGVYVLKKDIDINALYNTQEKRVYRCRDCDRGFPSPVGLHTHECGSKRRKDREVEEREEARHRRERERQKENWRNGSSYDRRRNRHDIPRHDISRHDIPNHKIDNPRLFR